MSNAPTSAPGPAGVPSPVSAEAIGALTSAFNLLSRLILSDCESVRAEGISCHAGPGGDPVVTIGHLTIVRKPRADPQPATAHSLTLRPSLMSHYIVTFHSLAKGSSQSHYRTRIVHGTAAEALAEARQHRLPSEIFHVAAVGDGALVPMRTGEEVRNRD